MTLETLQRNIEDMGAYVDETNRQMVPISKVKPEKDNPRDPAETDYRDPDFRTLVENIIHNGRMNHTPIQVYLEDGFFKLLSGHRRLAALKKINELDKAESENSSVSEQITHIYGIVMPTPASQFQKRQMMFSAETTTKYWGDVRKFIFFRDMVNSLPLAVKRNPAKLYETMKQSTGMPASTVKTYCSFVHTKEIGDAMADLTDAKSGGLARQGRLKMIRACDRGVKVLTTEYPSLARQLTLSKDETEPAAQRALAKMFLKKLKAYDKMRRDHNISVGPGVAMERTVAEFRNKKGGPIEDLSIASWLQNEKEIFRQAVIEQTDRRNGTSNANKAMAHCQLWAVPANLAALKVEEMQANADDFQECADYFADLAKKFRENIRKRNSA